MHYKRSLLSAASHKSPRTSQMATGRKELLQHKRVLVSKEHLALTQLNEQKENIFLSSKDF